MSQKTLLGRISAKHFSNQKTFQEQGSKHLSRFKENFKAWRISAIIWAMYLKIFL
jgi:hypothetical protein